LVISDVISGDKEVYILDVGEKENGHVSNTVVSLEKKIGGGMVTHLILMEWSLIQFLHNVAKV